MLDVLKKYLDDHDVFNGETSKDLTTLTNCVTGDVAPQMIKSIAISEMMLYASQFRRYLRDPAKKKSKQAIPVNSIAFVLADSGACVSEDTEFMTPSGWKKIKDYNVNDQVLSVTKDKLAHFAKPLDYIKN